MFKHTVVGMPMIDVTVLNNVGKWIHRVPIRKPVEIRGKRLF
jgi:hypothetical protein